MPDKIESSMRQQREYLRLSGLLQQICARYRHQLPRDTTSVRLTNQNQEVTTEAFDQDGQSLGTVPPSTVLGQELSKNFANVSSLDPDGVIALV